MKTSRTINAKRGILTGTLKHLVNLGLPFVSRTIILYILGAEYLGLGGLFSSILSFLSLAELGVSNAMVYSMYKPIAEGNKSVICALLALYRKLYRIIGGIILSLGLICMPFLPYLIEGEYPADMNIYLLYSLYLVNAVVSYFLFAYRGSLLTAHQRVDVDNVINTIIPLCNWIVQIAFLFIFRSYYAYVVFIPTSTIVTNFVRLYCAKKLYPEYRAEGTVPKELEKSIFKKIRALLGAKISTTILHSSDNIVISAFLGLSMVTTYGNYHYIMGAIGGFIGIIYSSILPGIGNSVVTESTDKNYHDFKRLTFINCWIVGWCAICLLCLFQPFIGLWAGKQFLLPFSVVLLIVIYFVLSCGRKIVITYKDAAGLWWEDRIRPFVMAGTNLISNLILVQFIGIWGIIVSTILSFCVSIPWETYTVFKYVFKRSSREYVLSMLKFLLVLTITAAITLAICGIITEGIWALLVRGCICIIIPNLLFYLAFRKMPEFGQAKELVKKMLKR